MKSLLAWLRTLVQLVGESLRDAIPNYISQNKKVWALLCSSYRRKQIPRAVRRRSPNQCVPINHPAVKQPDPLIYSQDYLLRRGLAVTWDNPDIQLYFRGTPVPSSPLQPDTDYEIEARIWNNSNEAPVAGLPVRFSYVDFGIGTRSNPIAGARVNLGVRGGPDHPAFARVTWHTPPLPGRFCLRVLLDWFDDANPNNNLGQENVNRGRLHSPAEFTFTLRNPSQEQLAYRFETDAYRLPPRPACPEQQDPAARELAMRAEHDRSRYPVPDGWTVVLSPAEPVLAAGAEETIHVTVTAPDGFRGTQVINVNAFSSYGPAGGVALRVEG